MFNYKPPDEDVPDPVRVAEDVVVAEWTVERLVEDFGLTLHQARVLADRRVSWHEVDRLVRGWGCDPWVAFDILS
jgi:hypothetical protein